MIERYDKLDCLLFAAVEGCGMDEVEAFNNLDITDVPTSRRYVRKKKRVIAKYKMQPTMFSIKRFVRVAVTVMLIVFSTAFITVMSVSAFRNAVLDVIVDWFDDYVKIEFWEDEAPKENEGLVIEDIKRITALPEGVEEEVRLEHGKAIMTRYFLDGKRICTLRQEVYGANEAFMDNTGMSMKVVYINGTKAYLFFTENGARRLYWNDGKYAYTMACYTDQLDIIELAKRIK